MSVNISADQLFSALAADERYGAHPDLLELLRPLVERLPEIVGEELMGKTLTLKTMAEATAKAIRAAIANNLHKAAFVTMENITREVWEAMAEMMDVTSVDPAMFLFFHGGTEEEVMLSVDMGLTESQKERYLGGVLTVGELVIESPGELLDFLIG